MPPCAPCLEEEVTIYCPAAYRPVSLEWQLDSNYAFAYLLTRQAGYLDYSGNWGHLLFWNPWTVTRTLYPKLNCVHGDDVGTISTYSKTVSASTGGGFVGCPLGTSMLAGGADWDTYETARSIDFTSPTSSGWYANGHGAAGDLHIEVHCIPLGNSSGLHLVQQQAGATSASVQCANGERVVSGGGYAYPVGGSIDPKAQLGRLISVGQMLLSAGRLDVQANISTGTTWLVAEALCAPVSKPTLSVSSAPSGNQSSRSISYSFTATDQAGEDLRYQCYLNGSAGYPCLPGTTNTITGLADGNYQLLIEARNDSNQTDSKAFAFKVDATPPVVTVTGQPADPTASTSASFTVSATDAGTGVTGTYCNLDDQTEQACASPASYDGLADGVHTFHWRAVDGVGNSTTGSYPWRVDTTKPTAGLTAPSAPFTAATSLTVKWSGSDTGAGLASFQLRWGRAPYNGTFGSWSSPITMPAATLSRTFTKLTPGYDYCYTVRAADRAGNVSSVSPQRCTAIPLDDRALTASPEWLRSTAKGYFNGTVTRTTTRNAVLTRTGARLDRLAVVATKCSKCGVLGVYVKGCASPRSASTRPRRPGG